jgi:alpha-tubulin suppressor-like RCC1 family protein
MPLYNGVNGVNNEAIGVNNGVIGVINEVKPITPRGKRTSRRGNRGYLNKKIMNKHYNISKIFFLFSFFYFLNVNAQPNNNCWSKVRAGDSQTLLVTPSLQHWAIGYNGTGVYGTGQFYSYYIPTQGVTSSWADVQTSGLFALAIKTNGTLWGWGSNYYYSLASTTTNDTPAPTQIGTANNWSKISTGNDFALAIKTDGTLWGWGHNNFHQLGIGITTNLSTITQLGTDTNWSKISAGLEGSLAIKTDGTLWGWGHNSQSSLGVASPLEINTITQIGTA